MDSSPEPRYLQVIYGAPLGGIIAQQYGSFNILVQLAGIGKTTSTETLAQFQFNLSSLHYE